MSASGLNLEAGNCSSPMTTYTGAQVEKCSKLREEEWWITERVGDTAHRWRIHENDVGGFAA